VPLTVAGLAGHGTPALRYLAAVVLYTCPDAKVFPIAHPCGRAAKALDDGGHAYELRKVKGGTLKIWTLPARARDRAEIERLSGQRAVPILVLDDGSVVSGSGSIVRWARENASVTGA